MTHPRENRIKLEDCTHRMLYSLHSRNLVVGVFNQETGEFHGIRTKFGNRFLDAENHYDAQHHGTASPLVALKMLPENISLDLKDNRELFEWLDNEYKWYTPHKYLLDKMEELATEASRLNREDFEMELKNLRRKMIQ